MREGRGGVDIDQTGTCVSCVIADLQMAGGRRAWSGLLLRGIVRGCI